MEAIKIEGVEYPIDRLMVTEVEAFERVTGDKMQDALASGSATALRALVWIARKRVEPTLAFKDVDFALEDLEIVGAETDEGDAARPTNPNTGDTSASDEPSGS